MAAETATVTSETSRQVKQWLLIGGAAIAGIASALLLVGFVASRFRAPQPSVAETLGEDGTILVYATQGTNADAAISAITALTKSPEVGDTYTGRVVKTTEFGAFVELKKGTDGLLHVSNVGPGRVAHIEDVMARGDVVDVIVQEVDKDRGRIGLKLVAKHEDDKLVQPEELIERAKNAPPREPREERPRGGGRGGDRGRDRGPRRD